MGFMLLFLLAQAVPERMLCGPGAGVKDYVDMGVAEFRAGKMKSAEGCFEHALKLNPLLPHAHLYLGSIAMRRWSPGDPSPASVAAGRAAQEHFLAVLDSEPADTNSLSSLAVMAFHNRDYKQARDYYGRLLVTDSENRQAWYSLGFINWFDATRRMEEGKAKGLAPAAIYKQVAATMEDGLRNLERAVELDPQMEAAMAQLAAIHRMRAELTGSAADVEKAAEWERKAAETRRMKLAPQLEKK